MIHMEYTTFTYSQQDQTGTLTLNRPQALNTLSTTFLAEMNQLLDQLEEQSYPPVLIITGTGKAFAAGADIAGMAEMNIEEARKFSLQGQQTLLRLEEYPMPVIAAINGYALGGGLELAMACDIRIATEQAKLGLPEASLGLIPGFGGTQRLPRLTSMGNALLMMLTCESITASEAKEMGLVQLVCEAAQLQQAALNIAQKISAMGPSAIRHIKRVVRRGLSLPLQDAYELETNNFSALFEYEGHVGMQAFLKKEKPVWEKTNQPG